MAKAVKRYKAGVKEDEMCGLRILLCEDPDGPAVLFSDYEAERKARLVAEEALRGQIRLREIVQSGSLESGEALDSAMNVALTAARERLFGRKGLAEAPGTSAG